DPVIGPSSCDDAAAVGVADENRRATHTPQRAENGVDVGLGCIEAVLGGDRLVALRLERGDQLVETRSVGPDPMGEDNARLRLYGHDLSSSVKNGDAPVRSTAQSPPGVLSWHRMNLRFHNG